MKIKRRTIRIVKAKGCHRIMGLTEERERVRNLWNRAGIAHTRTRSYSAFDESLGCELFISCKHGIARDSQALG